MIRWPACSSTLQLIWKVNPKKNLQSPMQPNSIFIRPYAKKMAAGVTSATARPGLVVETDPAKLTRYVCGANWLKEGSDPELKPDSEYPEWLWELDLEPHTKTLADYDKDSIKYWRKLRKITSLQRNQKLKLMFK